MRPGAYRPLTARRHSGGAMEFRILGPLEVIEGGEAIRLPGPKQRSLLALLLLHANEVVSSDRLIDELWPGEAAEPGAAALQARVSRLRKALGAGAGVLETVAPGYMLRLGLGRARSPALRAARRGGGGRRARDVRRRSSARRSPSGGGPRWPTSRTSRLRRRRSAGSRSCACSRSSSASTPISRSAAMRSSSPSSNRWCGAPAARGPAAQLMLALYRAGRQAEALEGYRARAGRSSTTGHRAEPRAPGARAGDSPAGSVARADPAARPCARSWRPGSAARRSSRCSPSPSRWPGSLRAKSSSPGWSTTRRELGAAATANAQCESLAARGVPARRQRSPRPRPARTPPGLRPSRTSISSSSRRRPSCSTTPTSRELLQLRRATWPSRAENGSGRAGARALRGRRARLERDRAGRMARRSWRTPASSRGPGGDGGRDASRLLASASLAVQRALGVVAEPLLVEPGPDALAARRASLGRRRGPLRPLAQGGPRPHAERACHKRSADAGRPQGPQTRRLAPPRTSPVSPGLSGSADQRAQGGGSPLLQGVGVIRLGGGSPGSK